MFVVLEWMDLSHSRKGHYRGFQNVLKSHVLEHITLRHSGMAKNCHFQNVFGSEIHPFGGFRNVCFSSIPEQHIFLQIRTQIIPKTLFLGGSGMFVFQAFWNITISPRSEHKSFPKHCFQGVPECLFFKHSGTAQYPLDQNTKHS